MQQMAFSDTFLAGSLGLIRIHCADENLEILISWFLMKTADPDLCCCQNSTEFMHMLCL